MRCRVALRLREPQTVRWCHCLLAVCTLALLAVFSGCGGEQEVPVGDAVENIRKLALGYAQFAGASGGVGPANQEALTKFMVERNVVPREEVEKMLVSPRDNQPYIIRWGMRTLGLCADPPAIVV